MRIIALLLATLAVASSAAAVVEAEGIVLDPAEEIRVTVIGTPGMGLVKYKVVEHVVERLEECGVQVGSTHHNPQGEKGVLLIQMGTLPISSGIKTQGAAYRIGLHFFRDVNYEVGGQEIVDRAAVWSKDMWGIAKDSTEFMKTLDWLLDVLCDDVKDGKESWKNR